MSEHDNPIAAVSPVQIRREIAGYSRERLLQLLSDLNNRIGLARSNISAASTKARETGRFADRDWFHRANLAVKIMGRQTQAIQFRLGEISRAEKAANRRSTDAEQITFERCFVWAAKELLPPDTYQRLVAEVERRGTTRGDWKPSPEPRDAPPR